MALKTALALSCCCVAQGARVKRSGEKTIGGVQVQNYRADAQDWLIVFAPGTTNADLSAACLDSQCDFMGHPDEGGLPFVSVKGGEEMLEKALWARSTQVTAVEPGSLDSMIPDIEEEEEGPTTSATPWGLDAVGIERRGTTRGVGVHIYVQDTGIRVSHEDFTGRAIPTIDVTSGKVVECNGDKTCAGDKQSHGTHCAGSAGGSTYGVADRALIHAVKTLSDQGSGARSWQYAALDWITANGERPTIISMSLGGSGADKTYDAMITEASQKGVTVVVAAGNSNADACRFSPAWASFAITVGATTRSDARATYSNFGKCVQIMAPGSAIKSAWSTSDTATKSISGTSMACPHVSGAAALLLQTNPALKSTEILSALLAKSAVGKISGLKTADPDNFLQL